MTAPDPHNQRDNSGRFTILFLSDTHLGFDMPLRPRVEKPRRGEDFFRNFDVVLERARAGGVDCVIHGGDILYRSKVPAGLVAKAFSPLFDVADAGIPVFVVPGNHERSRIPFPLFALHSGVHIFDRPRTFQLHKGNLTLSISGFPYDREGVRETIARRIEETDWNKTPSDVRLLCMHHIVEGSQVGVRNFTFRTGEDVIRCSDLPADFAAVLSGHIHRNQVLTHDLIGFPLATPVFYAGSTERTAFDERLEPKGYMTMSFEPGPTAAGRCVSWSFHELPTRPMFQFDWQGSSPNDDAFFAWVKSRVSSLPPRSIVRLRIAEQSTPHNQSRYSISLLRSMVPPEMDLSLVFRDRSSRPS